jgi:hypothetical protein
MIFEAPLPVDIWPPSLPGPMQQRLSHRAGSGQQFRDL